jgi:hypothetical protein
VWVSVCVREFVCVRECCDSVCVRESGCLCERACV